ncbi:MULTISPECIES: hypothetical protein [Streptococcus]|nr:MULTISPECIES: hypothetical protein [Streptococcus]EEY80161.1 hypothetical protein HMPREF0847_01579 [Streptococcus sp. 2_1_36FAA]RSJ33428.1 hypothetical protein D8821_08515 [Streptococcus gordonii]RSJ36904.1 hypothetical protein D8822_04855 [Streptococcus gordonii]
MRDFSVYKKKQGKQTGDSKTEAKGLVEKTISKEKEVVEDDKRCC